MRTAGQSGRGVPETLRGLLTQSTVELVIRRAALVRLAVDRLGVRAPGVRRLSALVLVDQLLDMSVVASG